jgi:DMSO/TMAO reductase YedYZ molybdopterin-dependent catalytic subunit
MAEPLDNAAYVTVISDCTSGCPEDEYTTSLPIEELLSDDVLLAYEYDGEPLSPAHGYPLRLVVPSRYAYKSAKWVRKLKFTAEQELGFWERRGYSNTADPWKEERYS